MTNGQPLKVTQSIKFLGVHIDNHLNVKLHVKHIEKVSLISRMRITRLNSMLTLLIQLYKIFTRPYLTMLVEVLLHLIRHRQKLEV